MATAISTDKTMNVKLKTNLLEGSVSGLVNDCETFCENSFFNGEAIDTCTV